MEYPFYESRVVEALPPLDSPPFTARGTAYLSEIRARECSRENVSMSRPTDEARRYILPGAHFFLSTLVTDPRRPLRLVVSLNFRLHDLVGPVARAEKKKKEK